MTEQQIQKKIIDEYEKKGYFVIKLIRTNKNGIPDLLCLKRSSAPIFIEVKTAKGRLSALQKFRINELNDLGFDAKVFK